MTASRIASHRDVTISAADGTPLHGWLWTRESPRGVLVIAHGLGEYGGCYRPAAEAWREATGLDVLAFDFRGHGHSPGRRGVVRRFDDLSNDLHGALAGAEAAYPGLPRFLLGHSNGGLVAARTLLDGDGGLAGLILSNPALKILQRVPPHLRLVGHVLRACAPGVTLGTSLDPATMTRDAALHPMYLTDPLRHTRISAPLFFGMIAAGARVLAGAGLIRTPTLLVLGGSDPVIDPSASREFFDRLGAIDKTLLDFPETLHEPLNDLDRERVIAAIADWLARRLALPSGSRSAGANPWAEA
jgi:alpha-beta hydrolase superfamily lysophospholipase